MSEPNPDKLFWELAEPLLTEEAISKGSLMGFPCLRVNGDFFATADHRSGDLIVKLPAERVAEMIEVGVGDPFAPAGRRFREWVLIKERNADNWRQLLDEARDFVATKG